MYLVLSAFTSSPVFLLAASKATVFFFIVCTLPPNINIISINQKLMCTIQFQSILFALTFLMAYSMAKLKSNEGRASPSFKTFLCLADDCLRGLCYRFRLDTFLLAVLVSWGYQTQWEYYTRLPS